MRAILVFLLGVLVVSGCSAQAPMQKESISMQEGSNPMQENAQMGSVKIFTNTAYNFSFSHPAGWMETTNDLPEKWAIVDGNKNTILFTVNPAPVMDIGLLGNFQAMRDVYHTNNLSGLDPQKVASISKIVRLSDFNNRQWYTYAIDFSDKNVQSLISGTLCGQNEVTLVLVANVAEMNSKKDQYTQVLESFTC